MGSKKSSKSPVSTYYMSIHFGICHGPVDSILDVYVGEKKAYSGNITTNTSVDIDNENLFGGLKKEGGVKGVMEAFLGGASQIVSSSLSSRLGFAAPTDCPGYRGITSVLFRGAVRAGFYWAAGNPYLKPIWFTVRRIPRSLTADNSEIPLASGGIDANPAHIIYECLTNTDWGMGADPSDIDIASFVSVAQTLFNEGFGLSMLWNQSGTIEDFVNEVLSHVAGSIFNHPRTGKITIKLLRDDYTVGTLRELTPDNAVVDSFSRKAWGETTNEMKVTWTNPANEKEESVYSHDLGNIAMQGQVVSDSRNYFGVRNSSLAQQLCDRELRFASAPLSSMEVTVDRSFWDVVPLDCVKVTWPEYGLDAQVMRVMKVSYGRTGASAIKLSLVEDIFSLPRVTFVAPPGSEWVDPNVPPQPITAARIFPLPAYMVLADGEDLGAYQYPETGVAVLARNPVNSGTSTFDVMLQASTPSGGTAWETELDQLPFVRRGDLANALVPEVTSTLAIGGGGVTPAVDTFLLIGSDATATNKMELALVTAYNSTTGVVTVRRGILDTIPRAWPVGTAVWTFTLDDLQSLPQLFTDTQSLQVKLITNTTLGSTPVSTSPTFTETVHARAVTPNRPANVTINGLYWPAVIEVPDATLSIAWARRNRLLEDPVVLAWNEPDVAPEAGTTYKVQLIRVDTGAVVVETTGVTGTSAALVSPYGGMVRLRVTAVRDGIESYQPFEHEFELITSEARATEDGESRTTESGEARVLEI